jgi:aminoglycoside/choline kinase family phosphotransferase
METDLKKLKELLYRNRNLREFALEPMPHGASVRRYYLLQFNEAGYFPNKNVVLMQVPLNRCEMIDDYFNISSYLSQYKVPNPGIFEYLPQYGWIFLELARGTTLDEFFRNNDVHEKENIYIQLLDFLIKLQSTTGYEKNCRAFRRRFDREKFQFEFQFHLKEQLLEKYFGHSFSSSEKKRFDQFSEDISSYLDVNLPTFVHRDFQSSNIFYHPQQGDPDFQIIDFQDARNGHPLYDLVSLLWDSYVDLPEETVNLLTKYYYANHSMIRKQFSEIEFEKHIDYLVIQRKLHDAGAFAYTFFLTQNGNYIQYIREAISMAQSKIMKYNYWPNISDIFQKIMETEHV